MTSQEFSKQIRLKVLEMVHKADASHIGGAFSMSDILAVLYNDILKVYSTSPKEVTRDRFFLSKGHTCAALYAALGLKGFFPIEELDTYAQDGSRFLSHASHYIPGVEVSSGSLGHALSIACGVAYAAKLKQGDYRVFCLLSDGELNEGSNWEPIMLAPQHGLNNLIVIVDYNKIQSLGNVKDIIDLEPLRQKFESFRWNVLEIDGHNHQELTRTFEALPNRESSKPTVVIANTIKGKGVDFMENNLLWHYKSPDSKQYSQAYEQLARQ
jgi:transketolase